MRSFKNTSLKNDWENPFSRSKRNSIKNSSGNDYRQGMNKVRLTGNDIKSTAGRLSGVGDRLMGHFDNYFAPSMDKAAQFADVNEQDMVNEASLDVNNAFDKMEGRQSRSLSRYGISPNSGKFQGQLQDLNLMRAAAEAGARNKSRIQARDMSFNRNMQVAGMAQPLAGQAANIYSGAGNTMQGAAGIHNMYAQDAQDESESRAAYEELNAPVVKQVQRRKIQLVH